MKGKQLSMVLLIYLIVGLFFGTFYDFYYRWGLSGFLSPGFFAVTFSWPIQMVGLFKDIIYYGPQGKPF